MADKDENKGWGIGDIISMLFGSALVVGVVGWIASSGIFGEQISAAIKSFVNQFLPDDMKFDDGKSMENYLTKVAENETEFAKLLESYGPDFSPETAKAIAKDGKVFLQALKDGGVDLERLTSNMGKLNYDRKLAQEFLKSSLPDSTKRLLFADILQKGIKDPALAKAFTSNLKVLTAVVNDDSISLEAISTALNELEGKGILATLEKNPDMLNLINHFDEAQLSALLGKVGNDNVTEMVTWLKGDSKLQGQTNADVVYSMINKMKETGMTGVMENFIAAVKDGNPEAIYAVIKSADPKILGPALTGVNLVGLGLPKEAQQAVGILAHHDGTKYTNLELLKTAFNKVDAASGKQILEMVNAAKAGSVDVGNALTLAEKHGAVIKDIANGFKLDGANLDAAARVKVEGALKFVGHATNLDNVLSFTKSLNLTPDQTNTLFSGIQSGDLKGLMSDPKLAPVIKNNVTALGDLISNKDGKGIDIKMLDEDTQIMVEGVARRNSKGEYPLLKSALQVASLADEAKKAVAGLTSKLGLDDTSLSFAPNAGDNTRALS